MLEVAAGIAGIIVVVFPKETGYCGVVAYLLAPFAMGQLPD